MSKEIHKTTDLKVRMAVKAKYGGRCAYCGTKLYSKWAIDHIVPKRRDKTDPSEQGEDHIDNYNPSCFKCNSSKNTWTVEQFRERIADKTRMLGRYCPNYNWAKSFGLIEETGNPVVFYFEKYEAKNNG